MRSIRSRQRRCLNQFGSSTKPRNSCQATRSPEAAVSDARSWRYRSWNQIPGICSAPPVALAVLCWKEWRQGQPHLHKEYKYQRPGKVWTSPVATVWFVGLAPQEKTKPRDPPKWNTNRSKSVEWLSNFQNLKLPFWRLSGNESGVWTPTKHGR